MLRSMYSGISGMKNFQVKLDVIGNNISNVNTVGFKKSTITFQDLLSQNLSSSGANPMQVGLGSTGASLNVNHNPGSAMSTGVGTDLTIMGDGFFVVQDPEALLGEGQYLTRAGNFTVTAEGNLVTAQGYNVLGADEQPINIAGYDSYAINRLGEVIGKQADGTEVTVANVGIASPENPTGLRKFGGSLYEMTNIASPGGLVVGNAVDAGTEIGSGMLEMSNVDLTEEFTEMIIAQRGFQANSRTITTSDELLQEVVNLKR
ncbi:flagellar hook-basal body complex protein [Planococcus sp. CP5-4]|uniref:flagellar hook-basal body complex protein n=1 Tax=unclassified Planococcus (in: firmicutes) TaxID=2662419 RepID=UPI001C230CFF|nr:MULTISPECIES: flagellar hook-basal body complex protein [unclassified Planococcus (in: firmicutes)]MBU9672595.1 flagellar hook-basal body complex protein [Planococcus sp. CP5-4_YE]MBV0909645.1 flagellar hook-basal body complex protein [Planococcus sp. CP5-4_UN]MBW6064375.1 flagellar hook-basal body complex protein [Planococcus sp. CP5-4]